MRYALGTAVAIALSAGAAAGTGGDPSSPVLLTAYAAGCALAVLVARGSGIVPAMAQPPLILLLAVVVAVAVDRAPTGLLSLAVDTGEVMIADFPVMGAVTAGTVLLGVARLWRLRSRTVSDDAPAERTSATGTEASVYPVRH